MTVSLSVETPPIFAIETEPAGAKATLSGNFTCKTPCVVELDGRGEHFLSIENKQGGIKTRVILRLSVDSSKATGKTGAVIFDGSFAGSESVPSVPAPSRVFNGLAIRLVEVGQQSSSR